MCTREVYTIKCLQPTGGSVMFWGCVSALSVGDLVKRDCQILIHYAISTRKQASFFVITITMNTLSVQ